MNYKSKIYLSVLSFLGVSIAFFLIKRYGDSLNPVYFLYTFISYSIVIMIRSFKMKNIINVYKAISFKEVLPLTSSSQLMGAFIPGRAGELLVSAYLKLKYALDISRVLPILFLDKLVELMIVLTLSLISIFFFNRDMFSFLIDRIEINGNSQYIFIAIIGVCALVAAYLLIRKFFHAKVRVIVRNIKDSIIIPLKMPRLGAIIILCSLSAIIFEYLSLYYIFHAFKIEISLSKLIITHSLGMIIGVISMIPGGQGSTEVTMISVLHLWGYSAKSVITPILASKIFTYVILFIYAVPLLPYSISIIRTRKNKTIKKVNNE